MPKFEVTVRADALTITVWAKDEDQAEEIGLARWHNEYNIDQVYAEPVPDDEPVTA